MEKEMGNIGLKARRSDEKRANHGKRMMAASSKVDAVMKGRE